MRPREGLLVRPLLEFTREQTAAYCTARGLTWREDESNDSDAYARNRIRAALVPALEAVHPGAADNVIAVAEILREEAAVLDALVDEVLERRDRVRLARLREVEPALARLVVQRLADDAAGGPASGVARRAAEILALDERGTVQLGHGRWRRRDRRVRRAAVREPRLAVGRKRRPSRCSWRSREAPCSASSRSPASSDRRRASPACSIARRSATICWCGRGGPVTGWRRSAAGLQEPPGPVHRAPGSTARARGRTGGRVRGRDRVGGRASPRRSASRSPTRPRGGGSP